MNRIGFFCVLIVVIGVFTASAQSEDVAPLEVVEESREVHLTPIRVPGIERQMTVVEFESPAVGRNMKYMALLPENYHDTEKRYPVLYMLHGFSQNYTVFPRMGVPDHTEGKDLIVVMPDNTRH